MRAAGLQDVVAAGIPSRTSKNANRRRTPSQEARLARAADAVVAEVLEERRLFAISVSLSGTVLVVQGDSAANDLTVYQENHSGVYRLGVIDRVPDPDVRYENANWYVWDEYSGVLSIDFDGNGGNDTLAVERDADNPVGDMGVDVPVDMYGGGQADILYGGDYADTIGGGDELYGYGGNDTLRGYENADWMQGDAGNDLMYGGDGNDQMFGGDGADVMYGEYANDSLTGNTGSDTMYGGDGNDWFDAFNDGSGDSVDGGLGSDTAWRDSATDSLTSIETTLP